MFIQQVSIDYPLHARYVHHACDRIFKFLISKCSLLVLRNVIYFVLAWYMNVLNSPIMWVLLCFCFRFLGIFCIDNHISVNRNSFVSSFPVSMSFIFFLAHELAKTSRMTLDRSMRADILYLFPVLEGKNLNLHH